MEHPRITIAVTTLWVTLGLACGDDTNGDTSSAGGSGSATSAGTGTTSTPATGTDSASSAGSGSGSAGTADGGMTSSTGGSDSSEGCDPPENANPEYLCCGGAWIDPRNDAFNCGDCSVPCEGETPFCDQGTCTATPCESEDCTEEQTCCGGQCCDAGTICCAINGPVGPEIGCVPPSDTGTCPAGCSPLCMCMAPETPIATPTGDRPIASLEPGDLVFSEHAGATTIVPIESVQRVPAPDHRVVRMELDDGRVVRISASHPLADGRTFHDLATGQSLGHAEIVDLRIVAYDEAFTHDILPRSSTGTYFVAGQAVATTMTRNEDERPRR